MADPREDADTTSLEDLDWDPVCEIKLGRLIFGQQVVLKKCELPARWIAECPECGATALICDAHHASKLPFACSKCKARGHKPVNWRRI